MPKIIAWSKLVTIYQVKVGPLFKHIHLYMEVRQ